MGVIDDLRHCIDNPSDGPVIADGFEVQFPGSAPTARLLVGPELTADGAPAADPRDCRHPTVREAARFLSKHFEGEWHSPERSRADGADPDAEVVIWELA